MQQLYSITRDAVPCPLGWLVAPEALLPEGFNHAYRAPAGGPTVFYFSRQVTPELEAALDVALAAYDPNAVPVPGITGRDLALAPYLEPALLDAPYNVIDFKRHLASNAATVKAIDMAESGRPERAVYTINGQKVAEILFIFRNQSPASSLMARRTTVLYYVLNDGTAAPGKVLTDQPFNFENRADRARVIDERAHARSNITKDVSASALAVLSAHFQEPDPGVIGELVAPFHDETRAAERDFIELGTSAYKDHLASVDLETTPHVWLAVLVGPGVTVRDFMVSALTYTTTETHLDYEYGSA